MTMSRDYFSRRYSVVAETRRQWRDAKKQAIIAERRGSTPIFRR